MIPKPEEQPKTPFISGVSEIADSYDAFIIDIWGVVHNGISLNTGSTNCLEQMQKAGKDVVFLSNTPLRSSELEDDLISMGLSPSYCQNKIMTAGESTWNDLHNWKDGKVFLMGYHYEGLLDGLTLVDDVTQADCILSTVGGSYRDGDAPFFKAMELALPLNIPFICANPDLEVQVGDTISPCAGHYAQWYEERGGEVHWHGKPYNPVYERAWNILGNIDKSRICAIGDSLRTDITGAKNFGISGLWNLDGINSNLNQDDAQRLLTDKNLSPHAVIKGFAW